jgi:hypothetical protein
MKYTTILLASIYLPDQVLSYFPLPEALKRLFLEFSGLTGSEQTYPLFCPLCNCDWP